ncbi:MAG: class I SAM-dependent methyltransferase [Chthoniobacterales bacterium]
MKISAGSPFQPKSDDSHNQFDPVAPFYPALEQCVFGSHLSRARQAFFEVVVEADRILLVGEGNGRFLRSLVSHKKKGCVEVVEKSPVMIRLAKGRVQTLGEMRCELKFIETDFREYHSSEQFDCVVTHFFLDLFNPPAQLSVIERIAELTTARATWINVDFVPARTLRGSLLMRLQYAFFRIVSQIEAGRCFDESTVAVQSGWTISESLGFLGGLVVAKRYMKRWR